MGDSRTRKLIMLPGGWPGSVKSALLHAISLAFTALAFARRRAAKSCSMKHRLQADLDQARTENALLSSVQSGRKAASLLSSGSFAP
jgi:hypothetical protein